MAKRTLLEATDYLRRHGVEYTGSNTTYANRLASAAEKRSQAGLPMDRGALRGHAEFENKSKGKRRRTPSVPSQRPASPARPIARLYDGGKVTSMKVSRGSYHKGAYDKEYLADKEMAIWKGKTQMRATHIISAIATANPTATVRIQWTDQYGEEHTAFGHGISAKSLMDEISRQSLFNVLEEFEQDKYGGYPEDLEIKSWEIFVEP